MAKTILTDVGVWLDRYDIRGSLNAAQIEADVDLVECTSFGDVNKAYLPGVKGVRWSFGGYYEDATDAALDPLLGANGLPLTITGDGVQAGAVAYLGSAAVNQLGRRASLGEAVGLTLAGQMSASGFGRGTLLHNGAVTATGSGAVQNIGAAVAGQKVRATLHVTAAAGTTPSITVAIQSAALVGFGSPVTHATFTAATGLGAQHVVVDPANLTHAFWRASWTVSGTTPAFTIAVALAKD